MAVGYAIRRWCAVVEAAGIPRTAAAAAGDFAEQDGASAAAVANE